MAQRVKRLPAVRETRVPSLSGEGPLEKGMAAHSSILAQGIPWTEELQDWWATVHGVAKSRTRLSDFIIRQHRMVPTQNFQHLNLLNKYCFHF